MTKYEITEDYITINKRRFEKSIRSRGVYTPFEIYLNKTNHKPQTIATFTDENAARKAFSELQPEQYIDGFNRFYVYYLEEYDDIKYQGSIDCKTTPCERVYSVIVGVGTCPIANAKHEIENDGLLQWENVTSGYQDANEYRHYDYDTAFAAYNKEHLRDVRIHREDLRFDYKLIFDIENNETILSDVSDCNINFAEVEI